MTDKKYREGELFELYLRLSRLAAVDSQASTTQTRAWLDHAERLARTPAQRLRVLMPRIFSHYSAYDEEQIRLREETAELAYSLGDEDAYISAIMIAVMSAVRARRPFDEVAGWLDLSRRLPFVPDGHTYSNVMVAAAAELHANGASELAWHVLRQAVAQAERLSP